MRVMIVEDEAPAVAQLEAAIARWDPHVHIVAVADSIRHAVTALRSGAAPDLIFADIRLGDGLSFRIFDEVDVQCPVVFATAYDEHVIAAMERNAIDYLFKPIEPKRVAQALEKYVRLRQHFGGSLLHLAEELGSRLGPSPFQSRVLARKGAGFVAVPLEEIAWFTTEHRLTLLVDRTGKRLVVDDTLSEIEARLDPRRFFRVSRQVLAQIDAIESFRSLGKGRLEVKLNPPADDEVVVSQESAAAFRQWIAG